MIRIEDLTQVMEAIQSSPLRRGPEPGQPFPIQIDQKLLAEEPENMKILIENVLSPLRVAVMGEVKAGKSTLINAIAGSEVSPANVIEATAAIIEIKYSPDPYGKIFFEDQEVLDSPQQIFETLNKNRNDQSFFSRCIGIEIGIPLANLKNISLVDTPGLETITLENAARSERYLQKADVILWVFNGHHLGQIDVEHALIKARSFGKPILALVNRIDEMDADPDRIIEYMEDQIGIFVKNIFPISAGMALQAIKDKNGQRYQESGVAAFIQYMEEHINRHVDDVKRQSIQGAATALVKRDMVKHEEYLRMIQFIEDKAYKLKDQIQIHNEQISGTLIHEIEEWYDYEFLKVEQDNLRVEAAKLGFLDNQKGHVENITKKVDEKLDDVNIQKILQKQMEEMDHRFNEKWEEAILNIRKEVLADFRSFQEDSAKRLDLYLSGTDMSFTPEGGVVSGAASGALVGSATGATAAFYSAVLGPAASYVSIGMAASTFILPFAMVGATMGAVTRLVGISRQREKLNSEILHSFRQFKKQNRRTILEALVNQVRDRNQMAVENLLQNISAAFFNGCHLHHVDKLKQQINGYTRSIKLLSGESKGI